MGRRREFLKMLGVGSIVAPIVDGLPAKENLRIIEPPKVEAVEAPKIISASHIPDFHLSDVVVFVRDRKDGSVIRFDTAAVVLDAKARQVSFPSLDGPFTESIPGPMEMTLKITGEATLTNWEFKIR